MSASPVLTASITVCGLAEGVRLTGTPMRRPGSRARSADAPRNSPLAGSRTAWAGLLARKTARSVPVGAMSLPSAGPAAINSGPRIPTVLRCMTGSQCASRDLSLHPRLDRVGGAAGSGCVKPGALDIVAATDLPVSADLEKGFGDAPAAAAETIRLAAEAGVVGASIEDATGDKDRPLYDIGQATERVAAAAQAARALSFPFILTARSENFLRGKPSLDDTITRLQAFERAGADVLFAPGLPDLAAARAVCAAVSKPVNFMVGIKGKSFTLAALEAVGVRRISLAASLYRMAMTGLLAAAREVKDTGTFGYLDRSLTTPELNPS